MHKHILLILLVQTIVTFGFTQTDTTANLTNVDSFSTSIQIDTNKINLKPKISLAYSITYNYSNGSGRTSRKLTHYYLDQNTISPLEIGFLNKNVGSFLKMDPLANKHYKNFKTCSIISKGFQVIALGGLIGVGAGIATENDEIMTASLIALVPSFAIAWVVNSAGQKQFKTSVKVYNQNAGYGYVNGLEKRK